VIALLEADPELGEDLAAQQFAIARERVLADVVSYPPGRWSVKPDDFDHVANLGLLLVDGLLAREVTVADYTCVELLGPGDVLQPWLRIGPDHSVVSEVDWDVVEPVRLARLDRKFLTNVEPWPEIPAAVSRRLMQRTHWLAFHLAVCGLRRIDDRLLIVLWHFADRWGSVTPDGVRVDVRLTHELLAAVVGARRPSVTTALGRLIDAERVEPRPRSRWLLRGDPPPELREVQSRTRRSRGRRA
jgi:hypothetical protein